VWFQNRKARRESKSGTFYSLVHRITEAIITEIFLFSGQLIYLLCAEQS
jgi:hypothetical protein